MNGLGWIPDRKDERDFKYGEIRRLRTAELPDHVDLRTWLPQVEDQGAYNACVAHSLTSSVEYLQLRAGKKLEKDMSRMFVYWNARAMDNIQNQDGGCMIRSAIKSVVDQGVCPEDKWKYTEENVSRKPGFWARWAAKKRLVKDYYRIELGNLADLQAALAEGYPVVFGTVLYDSFRHVGATGVVPMPDESRENILGLHAMLLCGYNSLNFLVQNSWGLNWGNLGYCSLPFEYLSKYGHFSTDFWIVRKITKV